MIVLKRQKIKYGLFTCFFYCILQLDSKFYEDRAHFRAVYFFNSAFNTFHPGMGWG